MQTSEEELIELTNKQINVMIAFSHGKTIQYKHKSNKIWITTKHPNWNFSDIQYRIKPLEAYISVYDCNGELSFFAHKGKEDADTFAEQENDKHYIGTFKFVQDTENEQSIVDRRKR